MAGPAQRRNQRTACVLRDWSELVQDGKAAGIFGHFLALLAAELERDCLCVVCRDLLALREGVLSGELVFACFRAFVSGSVSAGRSAIHDPERDGAGLCSRIAASVG